MHKSIVKVSLIALVCLLSVNAKASLMGDDVTLEVLGDGFNFLGPFTETVGPGAEFDLVNQVLVDLGPESIDISIIEDFGAWGLDFDFILSDLDWVGVTGEIVDIALTTFQGAGSAVFTGDSVTFSVPIGANVTIGEYASIELITRHSTVPLPATPVLLALGLLGLGLVRRSKSA